MSICIVQKSECCIFCCACMQTGMSLNGALPVSWVGGGWYIQNLYYNRCQSNQTRRISFSFFLNRTYYRGIPSKGYNVFFQRPHEQLTENNRKLGSAQFQKSSSDIVRTKCCCLAQSSLISELWPTLESSVWKPETEVNVPRIYWLILIVNWTQRQME